MKKGVKTKQNKKVSLITSKRQMKIISCLIIGILIGFAISNMTWQKNNKDPRYSLASKSSLDASKAEITSEFKEENSTNCDDSTDPISPADRQKVFDKYLKVNKYNNRAVIRGCNEADTLLAKDPVTGKWQATGVNISLDLRANPAWQVECLIDDITKPDDVVRSENSSIDTYNLVACRKLKEREQIVDILSHSGTIERSKITDKDINTYIKGGENF